MMSEAFFSEQSKKAAWAFVADELSHEAVGGRGVEVAKVVDGERQVDVADVLGRNDEDLGSHLKFGKCL